MNNRPRKKTATKSFKRLVLIFVGATVVVFAAVTYFAFSKTVLVVTPRIETTTADIPIRIGPGAAEGTETPAPAGGAVIAGRLLTTDVEATETFSGISEQREEPANVSGTVTISNHWSRAQPLAAGTRLLSETGVLFRTTERVDVPAGGSVETTVLADEPGKTGEIEPSRFEIIALWEGLKSQIFAESSEAFSGGSKTVSRVTQEDLNKARKDSLAAYNRKAAAALTAELAKDGTAAPADVLGILPLIAKESATANIGDEVTTFTYTLKGTAVGAVADRTLFTAALTTAAEKLVDDENRLLGVTENAAARRVTAADTETGIATVTAAVAVDTVVRLSSGIFSRSALVQKDRQDLVSHFAQFDEVAGVNIHFSPFWVFRAPALPDHIEIRLADPVKGETAATP